MDEWELRAVGVVQQQLETAHAELARLRLDEGHWREQYERLRRAICPGDPTAGTETLVEAHYAVVDELTRLRAIVQAADAMATAVVCWRDEVGLDGFCGHENAYEMESYCDRCCKAVSLETDVCEAAGRYEAARKELDRD
jgi:hypothetical protein